MRRGFNPGAAARHLHSAKAHTDCYPWGNPHFSRCFRVEPALLLMGNDQKDILHCLPCAVGVPLKSALNLVGLMSPCGTDSTHIAVLGAKITCSVFNDRADGSSIHRGTYHIIESASSTCCISSLSIVLWLNPVCAQSR